MTKVLKSLGKGILAAALVLVILAVTVLLFLRFWPSVGKFSDREERAALEEKSKRYYDGKFHNEKAVSTMTGEGRYSGERKKPKNPLPAETPAFLTELQAEDLSATWFGHSSFLLQMGPKTVFVDPVFSSRSSPVSFIGPKRFSELPLTAEELPEIDVLFLSHDHYDHLDYRTIRTIREKTGTFVVTLGVDAVLRGWGVAPDKIRALDWWESVEIGGVTCTLTPSQHFSGRNPLKGNSTLWGGLYLDNGVHRVYYTGDGGYNPAFTEVRESLGAPELMIAECGQYDPAWANVHMFPEETVQAGLDAGAERLIPVHWGSFCICNHAWDDSIWRVTAAADAAGLQLAMPQIVRTVTFADLPPCTEAWWEACS